jgi:hydrogenase maturation protease
MRVLVLGLGNDLMSDDGIGILAARKLERELGNRVDVITSSLHGIALLDLFIGYDRAIVIDAIKTGRYAPGTIIEMDSNDLRPVACPSPHYTGLPEMLEIAGELQLAFPQAIRIFAVEVADPYTLGGKMNLQVGRCVDRLLVLIKEQLWNWKTLGGDAGDLTKKRLYCRRPDFAVRRRNGNKNEF